VKLGSLFEDRRGKTLRKIRFRHLYHMTSSHGFAFVVSRNALRSLSYGYVSTTYDPKNNSYYGGHHANLKFVLNGPKLAERYGAFRYDFHTTELGPYGERTRVSLKEREIGIDTGSIEPFTDFCEGLILLRPMFTQTMVQDLLYDHNATQGFLSRPRDAAPRGIEALLTFRNKWGLPIQIDGDNPRPLTDQEEAFLQRVHEIHTKGGNFRTGMRRLTADFPIVDHFGKRLDQSTVIRLIKSTGLNKLFNAYFQNRRVSAVNPDEVRALVKGAMKRLGLNQNIQAVVMDASEKAGLFHPTTPVVEWSIVFGDLVYGDVERALEAIAYVGRRNAYSRERYDQDTWKSDDGEYRGSDFIHAGTAFTDL